METSLSYAKVIGPIMALMGLSLALNRAAFTGMAKEFMKSPALIFLAGFITLLLGLIVVAFHNVWVADWPVIITVLGWVMVASGIVRMNFADRLKKTGEKMLKNDALMIGAALLYIAIGAALTYFGWLAGTTLPGVN